MTTGTSSRLGSISSSTVLSGSGMPTDPALVCRDRLPHVEDLCPACWTTREGGGGIEVGALVDAHTQPIHQLAPQPSRDPCQCNADKRQDQSKGAGVRAIPVPQQPAECEERDDHHIASPVHET